MQQNISLRLLPSEAASSAAITEYIASATFAKTIIAFRVYHTFFVESGKVAPAGAHIFSSFENYGPQSMLYEPECRKQPGGACACNDHL